jgi:Spy/CpxP family protein refolding chaperone
MIATLVAATLAAQPAPAPAPVMDHGKMDHGTMHATGKAEGKMDCCKDGCACCAKDKAKPAS